MVARKAGQKLRSLENVLPQKRVLAIAVGLLLEHFVVEKFRAHMQRKKKTVCYVMSINYITGNWEVKDNESPRSCQKSRKSMKSCSETG